MILSTQVQYLQFLTIYNMQFWKVGNRHLTAEQMRAYRDGKLKDIPVDPKEEEKQLQALRDVENDPEVLDEPKDVETSEKPVQEASEDSDVGISEEGSEELSEEEIINSMEEDFAAYQDIGFKNLKGEDRENYKILKDSLEV